MFQSIPQNQTQASFTKMLSKDDRLVSLSEMTSFEIFNHFRAYLIFPKTLLKDKYFGGEVRIDDCTINDQLSTVSHITTEYKIYDNWLVTKTKQQQIFLICKNQTLLHISKITLGGGKQINLAGFEFK